MALVVFSQSDKIFKFFSSKLYKIRVWSFRARHLYFLIQNVSPFTTLRAGAPNPTCAVRVVGALSVAEYGAGDDVSYPVYPHA